MSELSPKLRSRLAQIEVAITALDAARAGELSVSELAAAR